LRRCSFEHKKSFIEFTSHAGKAFFFSKERASLVCGDFDVRHRTCRYLVEGPLPRRVILPEFGTTSSSAAGICSGYAISVPNRLKEDYVVYRRSGCQQLHTRCKHKNRATIASIRATAALMLEHFLNMCRGATRRLGLTTKFFSGQQAHHSWHIL